MTARTFLVMIVCLAGWFSELRAQEQEGRIARGKYIYCELTSERKALSSKTVITVDFGQASGYFAKNWLRDPEGNLIVFNSIIDAMNSMGVDGWEFVQAYVTHSGGGDSSIDSTTHWVLRLNIAELSAERKAEILQKLRTSKTDQ